MKREFKLFLTAVMFYTRIPVPKSIGFSPNNHNLATKYFTFIGILVGSVGAIVFIVAHTFLSTQSSVVFSLLSMIILTGAFHEDAISDFCDGFGGGYGKDKILDIMKDSHIGTYGGLSLVILMMLKVFLISDIKTSYIPFVIIAANSMSRIGSIVLMYVSPYVRKDDTSKSKAVGEKKPYSLLIVVFLFGVIPMIFLPLLAFPFILLILALIFLIFRYYIHRKIGGYTGDVMGALQEISEIGFYVSFIFFQNILCNFI